MEDGGPDQICEKCLKRFWKWTITKHIAHSKECKEHYGSRFHEMLESNRRVIKRVNNEQKLEKYHNLSKEKKAELLSKQKERRIAAKNEQRKKKAIELAESFKNDLPKKGKELSLQRKQQAEAKIDNWQAAYPEVLPAEVLNTLKDKINELHKDLIGKIDNMIQEVKDFTDHVAVSKKYDLFLKGDSQSPALIAEKWRIMDEKIKVELDHKYIFLAKK